MQNQGRYGQFGGYYVPEVLMPALEEIEQAFYCWRTDEGFKRELAELMGDYAGRPRVFHAIYLKIAGWNILRAAACAQIRKIVRERALAAFSGLFCHG